MVACATPERSRPGTRSTSPMDVQCERCGTEYEFDDALVSGRGTTVKCSNCAHQFKVRKALKGEDQWTLTRSDGSTFVYTSLRELQRAILTRQVDECDLLERGGVAPRPIGQISELLPFFEDRARSKVSPSSAGAQEPWTVRSLSDMPTIERLDPDRTAATPAQLLEQHLAATRTPIPPPLPPPVRPRVATRPDFLQVPRALPDLDGEDQPTRVADPAPHKAPSLSPSAPSSLHPPSVELAPGVVDPPPMLVLRPPDPADFSSPPPTVQAARRARALAPTVPIDEPFDVEPRSRRSRRPVGGFVIAGVVVLALGGMGAYWARTHLGDKAAGMVLDARTEEFLTAGEKALSDGDLDLAKEKFDKASVLAEGNPRVLLDLAKLAALRADASWLKELVMSPGDEAEFKATKLRTAELAQTALHAADEALAVSADEPSAVRAKIDALRIAGQKEKARSLLPKVLAQGSQSETAYVLAALEMTEAQPVWSTVLERLRLAASSEGSLGRARAALVVALALAGDRDGARGELARLEALGRPHPLVGSLRSYVERHAVAPPPSAAVDAGPSPAIDVSALKALGGGAPSDPRVLVSQAEIARHRGDFVVAKRLYDLALQKNPTDSEALNGLAQVAHAQRDLAAAKDAYRRVLAVNGSYVPALVGLADLEWESGDRAAAQKSYREITERFPESAYPARVGTRAQAGASVSPPSPTVPVVPTPSTAPPTLDPSSAPGVPSAPPPPTPAPAPKGSSDEGPP